MKKKCNSDLICDTAMSLFKERGYTNVSVGDICQAAGIARSSFYAAFRNKKEVLDYMVSSIKRNEHQNIRAFLEASNDWERMWVLCCNYLDLNVQCGPKLAASLYALELEGELDFYSKTDQFNDYYYTLGAKCQSAGIFRNQTDIHLLISVMTHIAYQVAQNWCRTGGSFDLYQAARTNIEALFDVDPSYRAE